MGARIPRGGRIHGVRASALKRLLSRLTFTSVEASKALDQHEPEISMTLRALEADGMIRFSPYGHAVETWTIGPASSGLLAASIGVTATVERGLAVLEDLKATASEIALDETASHLVTEIHLFGSMLHGGDADGIVGDVDVAVVCAKRHAPGSEQQAHLEQAERAGRDHPNFTSRLFHPRHLLYRRLRSVSRLLSVHDLSEIEELGTAHRLVWRYDAEACKGEDVDGPLVEGAPVTAVADDGEDDRPCAPPLPAWRTIAAPPHATAPTHPELHLRLVRHLWATGRTPDEIASLAGIDAAHVPVLLTWDPGRVPHLADVIMRISRYAALTLSATLPGGSITATIHGDDADHDGRRRDYAILDDGMPAEVFPDMMDLLHAAARDLPGASGVRTRRGVTATVDVTITHNPGDPPPTLPDFDVAAVQRHIAAIVEDEMARLGGRVRFREVVIDGLVRSSLVTVDTAVGKDKGPWLRDRRTLPFPDGLRSLLAAAPHAVRFSGSAFHERSPGMEAA